MPTQHVNAGMVPNAEALIEILEWQNERGLQPEVAFVDAQGITGVAYGIDEGDTMGTAFFTSPGEDRLKYDPGWEDGHYVGAFERPLSELHGPIHVMYMDKVR